jgi:signal transduction histidine kinase
VLPRTIRGRVTAVAVVLTAVILVAASVLLVLVLRWQLVDNLDEGLDQRADTLEGLWQTVPDVPLVGAGEDAALYQVVDGEGAVVAGSPTLDAVSPVASLVPGTRTGSLDGLEGTYRVLVRVTPVGDASGRLLVAVEYDDVTDPLGTVITTSAVLVPLVVVVLGVVTWWITGRVLRPVDDIRTTLDGIQASDLSRRVPEPGTGDDIDRLAGTVNRALDRLEDAVDRQRRFVADASHELRSPLTRIRAELEVDLAHPDSADPRDTERRVLAETLAMQQLVDDLLVLARLGAHASLGPVDVVELAEIVSTETDRVRDRGRVGVDVTAGASAPVGGDPEALARAVRNLLDNAERHATTSVSASVEVDPPVVRVIIRDDGPGVAEADRQRIFDRFTRLDEARARDTGGAGLGLAIVRDVVARHGGSVQMGDGPGAAFVIELPLATDGSGQGKV